MRMRPMQGQVLVKLLPLEHQTDSGLFLAENRRLHDSIGRKPAQRARVVSLGVWPTTRKKQILYSYDFKVGDVVFVDPVIGKNLRQHPENLKLYDHREILAKEERSSIPEDGA